MDYKSRIQNSSIIFKLKSIAEEVFLKWLANARQIYGISSEAQRIDHDEIASVFLNHFEKAANALVDNKGKEKKAIIGWSFGYLCGHIQGSLDVEWFNKYVLEPSKEFDDLMKIKAIMEFFRIENTARSQLATIYDYFLKQRVHPTEEVKHLPPNVVLFKQGNPEKVRLNGLETAIMNYLRGTLEGNYSRLLMQQKTTCCPDITNFLDLDEVKKIVGSEHFA